MKLNTNWLQKHTIDLLLCLGLMLFAGFLRIYQLDTVPYGFHNDEVLNGYVGTFILRTGHDLYGNNWPILYFNNFGDYPNVVPMYLSGLGVLLFGSSEFGVRIPIALFGTLTVGILYCICRWLFRRRAPAIAGALALATLPWHIVLSRATAEGITASCIFVTGFTLVLRGQERKKWGLWLIGVISMLATYLLYPGFRILTPLAFIITVVTGQKGVWRNIAVIACLVAFTLTGVISKTEWGRGRFEQTSLFTHTSTIANKSLQYSTGIGEGKIWEARIFHNKLLLAFREFAQQYAAYFSFSFLLSPIGLPARYVIPEHGQLLFIHVLIIVIGISLAFFAVLFQKRRIKNEIIPESHHKYLIGYLWIFLIAPIPAAVTLDDVPNVHRTAIIGVLLCLVIALAVAIIWETLQKPLQKTIFVTLCVAVLSAETLHFFHYYVNLSDETSILARSEEQRTLAQWLASHGNSFDEVHAPGMGALPLHYLFVTNTYDPTMAGKFTEGLYIPSIDSILFSKDKCTTNGFINNIEQLDKRVVFINRAECDTPPDSFLKIETITYSNQGSAYTIYATRNSDKLAE